MSEVSVPVGTFGPTQVYFHATFVVSILVLALCGYGAHLVVFFGSLLFHEMGHILCSSLLGAEITRVDVWPFGAVARLERSWQLTPPFETAVALSGPLNSGLLFALGLSVQRLIAQDQGASALGQYPILDLLVRVNMGFFLVNLIPCLPLDGGRVLRAQASMKLGYVEASRKVSGLGLWAGAAMTGIAAVGVARGLPWHSFLAVGPLVLWGALEEKDSSGVQNIMDILLKSDRLARRKAISVQELLVSADATVAEVIKKLKPSEYHVFLVAGRNMKVIGRVTEARVLECFYDGRTKLTMKELMER